jgi:PAS domain S-box-containing protein
VLAERDHMRQHLERLPLAYIEMDANYRILEWNPAAERLFGYTREEALGRVCFDLILSNPIDDQLISVVRRIEAGDLQAHSVNGNRAKDGRIITCEWFNTPLLDAEGKFAGVISMGQDITERRRAMDELRDSKTRVQALSHRLLAVREQERGRLARELHDGISQTLTALALAFEAGINAPPRMRKAKLNAAREWLEKGLRQAREMANDLRPPMLDHLGLLPAVLWLIGRFNTRNALRIQFRHDGISGRLAPDVETVVFRLVEEALNNVVQHAKVNEASVRIWIQDTLLNVQVEDEGIGFEPEAAFASENNMGLAGIREQVELLGGRLVITSGIGDGTSLLAHWPV